jgi:protein-tyrosine phosphatase
MTYTEWFHSIPLSKITERLFVGNVCNAANLAEENPHKITAVLNVSTEPPYTKHADIVYLHIPFHDGHEIPPRAFAECLAFMKFCYENGHNILVHCAAGMSRSPTILASFMHYVGLHQFDLALEEIRKHRPVVMPAPAIIASSRRWLRLWPHDGSMGESEPQGKLDNTITDISMKQGALWHSNPDCQWREVYEQQKYILGAVCICSKIDE